MGGTYFQRTLQVRDRAGDLDDAEVGAHRKTQFGHQALQCGPAGLAERAKAFDLLEIHLRIGRSGSRRESVLLHDAGPEHPRRNDLAGLGLLRPHDAVRGHRMHPDVQIDPVHNGPGQLREVALPLGGGAGAAVPLAVVAAGAGVGRRHEHEGGGELHLRLEAGNADAPVLDRPPEGLDDRFGHLPDFVEEGNFFPWLINYMIVSKIICRKLLLFFVFTSFVGYNIVKKLKFLLPFTPSTD